ncbi:hypothetical protein K443DRAFT_6348 [Laccaria amethystina LaAM-08-1]|uniref:Extracellular metalloproteinase n=1 Tax=Laccaria amethystina LaAM-08-1 TaxID=1095629 RepID=A0A0C9XKX1_9AGAR|nr:hypothetical protein K443DRAFT_6348 [Laccaria amethystina LaAM-08-1]
MPIAMDLPRRHLTSNNFGKGGCGNDRVQISIQDSSGTKNANPATPSDCQPGQCRMTPGLAPQYLYPSFSKQIPATEAGGMGEGWSSDARAEWSEQKSATITDYVMGDYVTNNKNGIRTHPHSTSTTTNSLGYWSIKTLSEVHNTGEVWANILHNIYAALISADEFSTTAKTNPDGTQGNVVFLPRRSPLTALQPNVRHGKAFASQGLGVDAKSYIDGSSVLGGELELGKEYQGE